MSRKTKRNNKKQGFSIFPLRLKFPILIYKANLSLSGKIKKPCFSLFLFVFRDNHIFSDFLEGLKKIFGDFEI